MASKMKFVALISGGKDSCYNVMECVRHGHELVALAHLCPEDAVVLAGSREVVDSPSSTEEQQHTSADSKIQECVEVPESETDHDSDSFMFQTVGSAVAQILGTCFSGTQGSKSALVPVFVRKLRGRSVRVEMSYQPTASDEVEDLYQLLREVKRQIPQVEAVASGAILSTYQRVRVEHVCGRLGLTSLAYLWQRNQPELLRDMSECMEAVIIKVACMGLGRRHLGKSISSLQQEFLKLGLTQGMNVCGEGGEYESMTLDCPLFSRSQQRVVIDEAVVAGDLRTTIAPVGYFVVKKFHLGSRDSADQNEFDVWANRMAHRYPLWHAMARAYRLPFCETNQHQQTTTTMTEQQVKTDAESKGSSRCLNASLISSTLCNKIERASNVSVSVEVDVPDRRELEDATDSHTRGGSQLIQLSFPKPGDELVYSVDAVFGMLEDELKSRSLALEAVVKVDLVLGDMNNYGDVNGAYKKVFSEHPPSRATIALPHGQAIHLQCVVNNGESTKNVLHVQSTSSWAPCNIGPYSQAAQVKGINFLAGQIPLEPCTMTITHPDCLPIQAMQSLWNSHQVLSVTECEMSTVLLATVFVVDGGDENRVKQTHSGLVYAAMAHSALLEKRVEIPCVVVGVTGLPRDALVETQLTAAILKEFDNEDSEQPATISRLVLDHKSAITVDASFVLGRVASVSILLRLTSSSWCDEAASILKSVLARARIGSGSFVSANCYADSKNVNLSTRLALQKDIATLLESAECLPDATTSSSSSVGVVVLPVPFLFHSHLSCQSDISTGIVRSNGGEHDEKEEEEEDDDDVDGDGNIRIDDHQNQEMPSKWVKEALTESQLERFDVGINLLFVT